MDRFLNHKLSHHAYDISHNAITQYFLNVLPPIGFFTSEGGKCCTNSHQMREKKERFIRLLDLGKIVARMRHTAADNEW